MNRIICLVAVLAVISARPFLSMTSADMFGSGVNQFEIEFVRIGDAGNPPDTTDRPVTDGAVAYEYRIGKYEISEQMIEKANMLGGLGIMIDDRGPDFPATSVTWYEAAQFVNWLNESSGHPLAYKFDAMGNFQLWEPGDSGYDPTNLYRSSEAFYFLPTLSEWHKAAYYDPTAMTYYDYPTGSDAIPDGINFIGDTVFDAVFFDGAENPDPNTVMDVGLLSPYGIAGQGGNVREWLESAFDRANDTANDQRFARGGSKSGSSDAMRASASGIGTTPGFSSPIIGFRVASVVPEPSTLLLLGLALLAILRLRLARQTFAMR